MLEEASVGDGGLITQLNLKRLNKFRQVNKYGKGIPGRENSMNKYTEASSVSSKG